MALNESEVAAPDGSKGAVGASDGSTEIPADKVRAAEGVDSEYSNSDGIQYTGSSVWSMFETSVSFVAELGETPPFMHYIVFINHASRSRSLCCF